MNVFKVSRRIKRWLQQNTDVELIVFFYVVNDDNSVGTDTNDA